MTHIMFSSQRTFDVVAHFDDIFFIDGIFCSIGEESLKCYYRPTASLQLNNKRNTKYNITVT